MKIKILKSGPWSLTGIGPTVHLKAGLIHAVGKSYILPTGEGLAVIDIENAEKMKDAGWAEEVSEKEATGSAEVEISQEETTEAQDVKAKVGKSAKPKRRTYKSRR